MVRAWSRHGVKGYTDMNRYMEHGQSMVKAWGKRVHGHAGHGHGQSMVKAWW